MIDISLSHYLTNIFLPDLSSVYWRWLPYEKHTVPTDVNDKVVWALPSSKKVNLKPIMTASAFIVSYMVSFYKVIALELVDWIFNWLLYRSFII